MPSENPSDEMFQRILRASLFGPIVQRRFPAVPDGDIVKWIGYRPLGHSHTQREVPMREKSSIKFEIPVPWASVPVCITASGRHAVVVAGTVAVIIAILLVY